MSPAAGGRVPTHLSSRRALLAGAIALAFVSVPAAYAYLTAHPVRVTPAYETTPAAAGDYVAWAQAPAAERGRYAAYLKKGGSAKVRVDPLGVTFAGGFDLASGLLVYQRIYGGKSNLRFYDLASGITTPPPEGVNTRQWECCASLSNGRLLFNREALSTPTRRVMLRVLSGDEVQLAAVHREKQFVSADQLNGDFAVWTKCTERCNVFRRDLGSGTTIVLPKPETKPARDQFGSSVTAGGTVYLVRSGPGCGRDVKIVRFRAGDGPFGKVIRTFSAGRDVVSTYASEQAGRVEIFYDRIVCDTKKTDIFKLSDPTP